MNGQTYSRGVLLWIDDRFLRLEERPEELWGELFGEESPRLFRLMDLNLQLAVSFDDALQAVERLTSAEAAGTYVVCIVDLKIPRRRGEEDQTRYGVDVAREIRRRNLPMFFLSSNSDATSILNEENLGTVPYYVKQKGQGPWRLPEDLARMVLSEFRNNVSWISLDDMVATIHEESRIVATSRQCPEAFRYFPFFGPFSDFVWRWESRERSDLPHLFVVKATVDHCDAFIQQALLLILYQHFTLFPQVIRVHYGLADDGNYLDLLAADHVREDNNALSVVRARPESTPPEIFKHLIDTANERAGKTIFVLPNDESCDRYSELLHEYRIQVVDELPQIRLGDAAARSELINRACGLMLQRRNQNSGLGGELPLPMGYLAQPQLLINPIHWTVLHEAKDVARALSDPYEISKELLDAVANLSAEQRRAIRAAALACKPVPYEHLLRVGEATLRRSDVAGRLPDWIEQALDEWLNTSWHFPYGLSKQFAQYESSDIGKLRDAAAEERGAWRCQHWEEWEDGCLRTLVGMLGEYRDRRPEVETLAAESGRRADLARVFRFVRSLGGNDFLEEHADIDWEELESLRWPHHRYPMPAAINGRLKRYGRYLWIQPEGLDLASALPTGRIRYRTLAGIVEQYSSVLSWGTEIADRLPKGWQSSVRYLTEVIRGHRVAYEWEHDRQEMWWMLLGLLRNGAPLMYVVDQVLRGQPLDGESKDCARSFLSGVKGYGMILGKLRGSLGTRLGTYLVPRWNTTGVADHLEALRQASALARIPGERSSELYDTLLDLLTRVGGAGVDSVEQLASLWRAWMSDEALGLAKGDGWFVKDLGKAKGPHPHAVIASLCGTKGDYLWHILDAFALLTHVTHRFRYFDGYHFLATLNDLRVTTKDTAPQVKLPVIETVLELFVASLEGLIAQLSWCLELHGDNDRARVVAPAGVVLERPEGFRAPSREELQKVQRVVDAGEGFAVYTLGIPGARQANRFCYHDGGFVQRLEDD